jgi:hypothetical protein
MKIVCQFVSDSAPLIDRRPPTSPRRLAIEFAHNPLAGSRVSGIVVRLAFARRFVDDVEHGTGARWRTGRET